MGDADGARCARHPDAPAELTCNRCGDFACAQCRRYRVCEGCAEHGEVSAFAPMTRARYRRFFVVPVLLMLATMVALGALFLTPPTGRDVSLATGCLGLLLLATTSFLFAMWRVPGSVSAATRAVKRHTEVRRRALNGETAVILELETLAADCTAYPKAHAELLLTLARARFSAGETGDAEALLDAIRRTEWLEGDPRLVALIGELGRDQSSDGLSPPRD